MNKGVAAKFSAVRAAGLTPVLCVGETLADREAGRTEEVVGRQVEAILAAVKADEADKLTLAYEPVWAIGTGKTASPEQAQAVHSVLRTQLRAATPHPERVHILYGGSMNAGNAAHVRKVAFIITRPPCLANPWSGAPHGNEGPCPSSNLGTMVRRTPCRTSNTTR